MPAAIDYAAPTCFTMENIFQDLTPDEVQSIARRARSYTLPANTIIHTPDEASENLFLLHSGQVKLYHLSSEGKMLVTGYRESGTIFGEIAFLGQTMYRNYAQTTAESLICVISRNEVQKLLLSDVRIANRVIQSLGKRLVDVEYQLALLALKSASTRTAAILLHRANVQPGMIQITHDELAQIVGTTRETVTKTLNDFAGHGWIQLKRGRILLVDMPALHRMAQDEL
jgi:CRP/FNR family transcriptional regulator, cyclic AMP receptor protein